jgi:hypothetical protein
MSGACGARVRAKRSAACTPFVKLLEARRIDLAIELREVTARLNFVSPLAAACDTRGPLREGAAFGGFMSRT